MAVSYVTTAGATRHGRVRSGALPRAVPLKVRFPDGREVTYRSVDDLRKAKAEIEEDIRQASGKTGSRVRFAQHQRGDGPTGPTR